VESVSISQFKTKCLAMLEKVRATGEPLLVTRRGSPIAEVIPAPSTGKTSWLGTMQGTGSIVGDIIAPAASETDWEVLSK